MLTASFFLFGIGVVCWALLVNDSYIAIMWSNSFCWLPPDLAQAVYLFALGCAIGGSVTATACAVSRPNRRVAALVALTLNAALPFAAFWSDSYFSHLAEAAQAARH